MTGNTTGTVRVACSNGPTDEAPWAKITWGASAANSAACLGEFQQHWSWPNACRDAAMLGRGQPDLLEVLAGNYDPGLKFRIVRGGGVSTPMRLIGSARSRAPRTDKQAMNPHAAEEGDELAPLHGPAPRPRNGSKKSASVLVLNLLDP